MTYIPMKDILINARQEAYRMRHFYLGVEHLFIALLEIKGGLASRILEPHGQTPEYVIDAIRRKVSKGGKHRLWAGIPNTPRADVILGIAGEIALEEGRKSIHERDILTAILEEKDNIATRVLNALGLNVEELIEAARNPKTETAVPEPQTFLKIDFSTSFDSSNALTKDQLFILRRVFKDYYQIRIERKLLGGYNPSLILVVTPFKDDTRQEASVIVKIGETGAILDEAMRYEMYVKDKLPPLTSRLEDVPSAPESSELAGLTYRLAVGGDTIPQDLHSLFKDWGGVRAGRWIQERLYPTFGSVWWKKNREYRFEVWREYDWLLPPIFTLEHLPANDLPAETHVLRFPAKRNKLKEIEYGDTVVIENFIVKKVDKERKTILLGFGQSVESANAFKIEVRNINFDEDTYYRGEVVEQLAGRVWKTREEHLSRAARRLTPDFDLETEHISFASEKLPNPITGYLEVLEDYSVNGSMSTIHGDLHLGNIIVGPNQNPSLIDFAQIRDGHTLFDWAVLEISLLAELVMPLAGESWDDARDVLKHLSAINHQQNFSAATLEMGETLESIKVVRQIVSECLARPNQWAEYFVALALCSLRAMTWDAMPFGSRRLMFYVSALAMHELRNHHRPDTQTHASTDDSGFISKS